MAEPPEDLYSRKPWLWDCAEDYDEGNAHDLCVSLKKKRGGKQ